jgi:hypothetical protein
METLLKLTVIFAWMSYFLPFFVINRQVNSSTLALMIWNRSWLLGKSFSRSFISNFKLFKQIAIISINFTFHKDIWRVLTSLMLEEYARRLDSAKVINLTRFFHENFLYFTSRFWCHKKILFFFSQSSEKSVVFEGKVLFEILRYVN